jgi:uncharacterized protein YdaU (DUF1376 family)
MADIDRPEPFVPADHDVSMLSDFRLNVDRLLASELVAIATPEECWAALMLWCRAWKQMPGGSLPNDDRALASFSGAGRRWSKVRDAALHGFVLCSDGRLYHRFLCEEVRRAYKSNVANQQRRDTERKRISEWRTKRAGNADVTPYVTHVVGSEPEPEPKERKEALEREAPLRNPTTRNFKSLTSLTEPLTARAKPDTTAESEEAKALKFDSQLVPVGRSAPSAPNGALATAAEKRNLLMQKLVRFCKATFAEPQLTVTVIGLSGGDPKHNDRWWLNRVHKLMLAQKWDDTKPSRRDTAAALGHDPGPNPDADDYAFRQAATAAQRPC